MIDVSIPGEMFSKLNAECLNSLRTLYRLIRKEMGMGGNYMFLFVEKNFSFTGTYCKVVVSHPFR